VTSSSFDESEPPEPLSVPQSPVAMLEARLRREGVQLAALREQMVAAKASAYAAARLAWPQLTEQRIAALLGVDRMTVRRALGKMPSRARGSMPDMSPTVEE
jgi:lambda repressor-like predicted transcriptional regulator